MHRRGGCGAHSSTHAAWHATPGPAATESSPKQYTEARCSMSGLPMAAECAASENGGVWYTCTSRKRRSRRSEGLPRLLQSSEVSWLFWLPCESCVSVSPLECTAWGRMAVRRACAMHMQGSPLCAECTSLSIQGSPVGCKRSPDGGSQVVDSVKL